MNTKAMANQFRERFIRRHPPVGWPAAETKG
jgi:hypothetical protein